MNVRLLRGVILGTVLFVSVALPVVVREARGAAVQQSMFGFETGEVRRYVLGPPEALLEGEGSQWSIGLREVTMTAGRLFAVFDLSYEMRVLRGPNFSQSFGRSVRATLVVNEDGFPGVLSIDERMNDGTVSTSWRLGDDGEYAMTITWPESTYDFDIPLPTSDALDVERERGLYLFGAGKDLRGNQLADFGDSLFANPGLLTLALPWPPPENGWERDVLLLEPPSGVPRYPSGRMLAALYNPARARQQSFSRNKLRLGNSETIEVGGRTVEAINLGVEGPFREAWVDRLGRVLLLEHESFDVRRPRHIRLLWPAEY